MCCVTGLLEWDKVCHLWKPIHHRKYGITSSLRSWQSQHKIHAYCIPRSLWYWKWLIQSSFLSFSFCMFPDSTFVHKIYHLCSHTWQVVWTSQLCKCFIMAEMSSQSSTMIFLQKVIPHWAFWYAQLISFEQQSLLNHVLFPLDSISQDRIFTCFLWFLEIWIIIVHILKVFKP